MDLYTSTELLGVIETVHPQISFWLPNYFTRVINFTTEEIFFDKISHNRTLAPFVAPNVQGKPMRKRSSRRTSSRRTRLPPARYSTVRLESHWGPTRFPPLSVGMRQSRRVWRTIAGLSSAAGSGWRARPRCMAR